MFDVYKIREDFEVLKRQINNKNIVYLDSAASAQKPNCVIEKMSFVYQNYLPEMQQRLSIWSLQLGPKKILIKMMKFWFRKQNIMQTWYLGKWCVKKTVAN